MTDLRYTHYVTNPKNAAQVSMFMAYECSKCHKTHMAHVIEPPMATGTWVAAAVQWKLKRLEEIPEKTPEECRMR